MHAETIGQPHTMAQLTAAAGASRLAHAIGTARHALGTVRAMGIQ
ncbi:hypothetical protein OH799_26650 [Nocardia sp. NBC_00881]|nr:hypothetical protein OH799_26650 [Nocardia sp. NBC_00881]